ncbi:hypothetical protein [Brevibacillus laterosporus]|uniref:hypothetical protein n=1 Tax=Brevibacillus laterosporus TaxID=1465 RepID=UPI0018CD5493|nr:hypothetical protein [Brevibacillus laterosporus]
MKHVMKLLKLKYEKRHFLAYCWYTNKAEAIECLFLGGSTYTNPGITAPPAYRVNSKAIDVFFNGQGT